MTLGWSIFVHYYLGFVIRARQVNNEEFKDFKKEMRGMGSTIQSICDTAEKAYESLCNTADEAIGEVCEAVAEPVEETRLIDEEEEGARVIGKPQRSCC